MLDKIYIVCYTYIMRVNPEQTYEKVLRGKYGEVYYLSFTRGTPVPPNVGDCRRFSHPWKS